MSNKHAKLFADIWPDEIVTNAEGGEVGAVEMAAYDEGVAVHYEDGWVTLIPWHHIIYYTELHTTRTP